MNENVWPLVAFLAFGAAVVLVPAHSWRELWPTSLVGGFLLAYLIQYLVGEVLGAWRHLFPSLNLIGIPVWLPLAWFFETLIFMHFLPRTWYWRLVYVLFFGAAASGLVATFRILGIRPLFRGWSPLEAFLLGVFAHFAVLGIDRAVRPQRVEV
ncbi:MAG: hypothetical protein AB1445_13915 [Bacillota bacterium]